MAKKKVKTMHKKAAVKTKLKPYHPSLPPKVAAYRSLNASNTHHPV